MVSFMRWGDPCVGTAKDSTESTKLMSSRDPRTRAPQAQESLSTHVLCPESFPGWSSCSPSGWMLIAGSSEFADSSARRDLGLQEQNYSSLGGYGFECLCVLYHMYLLQRVCLDWPEYLLRDCSVFYRIWGVVPLCLDYPLTMSDYPHGCLWTQGSVTGPALDQSAV